MPTRLPRVFLIRHGETEWSLSGQFTSITDLHLLPSGELAVLATGRTIFGSRKLLDPQYIGHVILSPRYRARQTWSLLCSTLPADQREVLQRSAAINSTDAIAEWFYGAYEGKLISEIRAMRHDAGLDRERPWDIWVDGCDAGGGESAANVSARLDGLIEEMMHLQGKAFEEKAERADIVVVAHGHILRAFVKRWLALDLGVKVNLMFEAGGVCGLGYSHGKISTDERGLMVGLSYPSGD